MATTLCAASYLLLRVLVERGGAGTRSLVALGAMNHSRAAHPAHVTVPGAARDRAREMQLADGGRVRRAGHCAAHGDRLAAAGGHRWIAAGRHGRHDGRVGWHARGQRSLS